MRHFVQYHNTEKMSFECGQGDDVLQILSKKRLNHLLDNTVWVVAGKGPKRRRSYFLCKVFMVDEVGPAKDAEFRYRATGHHGTLFGPLPIDAEEWFPAFMRSQANFSLGVQEIPPHFVVQLEALARGAKYKQGGSR